MTTQESDDKGALAAKSAEVDEPPVLIGQQNVRERIADVRRAGPSLGFLKACDKAVDRVGEYVAQTADLVGDDLEADPQRRFHRNGAFCRPLQRRNEV